MSLLLLLNSYNCRHASKFIWQLSPFSNPKILICIAIPIVFIILELYVPVLNTVVFRNLGLTWEWGITAGCVVTFFALSQLWKLIRLRIFPPPTVRDAALLEIVTGGN